MLVGVSVYHFEGKLGEGKLGFWWLKFSEVASSMDHFEGKLGGNLPVLYTFGASESEIRALMTCSSQPGAICEAHFQPSFEHCCRKLYHYRDDFS